MRENSFWMAMRYFSSTEGEGLDERAMSAF
jgi:hypothetical protein